MVRPIPIPAKNQPETALGAQLYEYACMAFLSYMT
jgi:hypothetical protein